jgi:molecular chaperone GrpE
VSDEKTRKSGAGGGAEGWQGLAEDAEGTLEPSREIEEAMRAADEAVARQGQRRGSETRPDAPAAAPASGAEGESLQQELAEWKDRYLRMAADLENFRKRALKDREEAHHFGHQNLVKDLLPSVDNLERAVDHARKGGEGSVSGLLEGVELVLGKPFDPALHEAMAQVPDGSKPANTVVEVFQRGYQLRGRLLRPARVVVSRPAEGSGPESREGD